MKTLEVLRSLIEEYDCETAINQATKWISFKRNNTRNKFNNYRLKLFSTEVIIYEVKIKTITPKATGNVWRTCEQNFVPINKTIMILDLHDPNSLERIREWLEVLR